MRGWVSLAAGGLVCLISWTPARGGMVLHFGQDHYRVLAGDPLAIDLILDANDQVPGDQLLPGGLFSMRFRLTFDTALAEVSSVDDVLLPPVLDDDGFGGPPVKAQDLGPGFVQVDAKIQDPFGADGFYTGEEGSDGVTRMRLATIRINPLVEGMFALNVHLVKRSASDDVFIDGQFNVLDREIRVLDGNTLFDTATVEVVIPEPSTLGLWLVGGGMWLSSRRRLAAALQV